MRYLVIPDLHGQYGLLTALLDQEKIPAERHTRFVKGIHVVQVGDLANCVSASRHDDLRTIQVACERVDTVLVGNHEYGYFGRESFNGFHHYPEIQLALARLGASLQPCLLVGDILLTHAGVTYEWGFDSAEEASIVIEEEWERDPTQALFARVGRARGGWEPYGSVLWSDFIHEPRAAFRQVHGHTPIASGPALKSAVSDGHTFWSKPDPNWQGAINLDVGVGKGSTRVIGLWLEESGAFEVVEHEMAV